MRAVVMHGPGDVRVLDDEDRVQLVFRPHSDTPSEHVGNQRTP
jgi:hypothetical protein